MGLTLSDINRIIYCKFRAKGLSHEEAIRKFPNRNEIERDLNKTEIESHFGMTDNQFFGLIIFFIIAMISIPLITFLI